MSCPRPSSLVPLIALVAVLSALSAAAKPPSPTGGCPPPPNTLVVNEFKVGVGTEARWVEIYNPGKYTLSLEGVLLIVTLGPVAQKPPAIDFDLGKLASTLPAGELLVLGHVPKKAGSPGPPYLGLKLIDLGPSVAVPCAGRLTLSGPEGQIDTVDYDICQAIPALPPGAAWPTAILDPAHAGICANDQPSVWCLNGEGDASPVATPGKENAWCDLDADTYLPSSGDCNDQAPTVHPGAVEACNGVDDNCNGQTDEDVVAPVGTCLGDGICAGPLPDGSPVAHCDGTNGFICSYPLGYESIKETLCDGHDNDCDGQTDEDLLNACGACGEEPAEVCNGEDDDCDGQTDENADLTALDCGKQGVCADSHVVCGGAAGLHCVQPLPWQATESLCDGLDNDCDGQTDEDLALGETCWLGVGACAAAGVRLCTEGAKVICSATPGKPEIEVCGDLVDNDCDGQTDEDFAVGAACAAGQGLCRVSGKLVCSADRRSAVCSAAAAAVPPEGEICGNALDDDCDGQTDEAKCTPPAATGEPGCGAAERSEGRAPALLILLVAALAGTLARRRRDLTRI